MLTGELPGKRLEPPSKKIHIDVRLDELVLRALEANPELRYQQASDVKTSVENIATAMSNPSSQAPADDAIARSTVDQVSAFTAPTGPVDLKLKWPLGARFIEDIDVRQTMAIYNPGQSEPVKQDLTLYFEHAFTVMNETPEGGREVELEFPTARMGMVIGSYQWQYDSSHRSATDKSQVATVFGKILDSRIRYLLNARNEVERMDGVDELVNQLTFGSGAKLRRGTDWDKKVLDGVLKQIMTGTREPDHFAWLKRMFNKAYFESKIRHYFLPTQPVQPGDTWPVAHEYSAGGARILESVLVRDFNVTFRAWEPHGERVCARLEFQGTEKTRTEANSNAAAAVTPIMDGTYSGVAWFDLESGRILEVVSTRDFNVTSNKPVNPGSNPTGVGPLQSTTDQHHQVITEKLISLTHNCA
jgi:hypothetical protein